MEEYLPARKRMPDTVISETTLEEDSSESIQPTTTVATNSYINMAEVSNEYSLMQDATTILGGSIIFVMVVLICFFVIYTIRIVKRVRLNVFAFIEISCNLEKLIQCKCTSIEMYFYITFLSLWVLFFLMKNKTL